MSLKDEFQVFGGATRFRDFLEDMLAYDAALPGKRYAVPMGGTPTSKRKASTQSIEADDGAVQPPGSGPSADKVRNQCGYMRPIIDQRTHAYRGSSLLLRLRRTWHRRRS